MSEMLQDGGNRFLGMVYGTTGRHSYATAEHSPAPVWKLWDSFGIAEARMTGYWDKACPVKTNHQNVKATAYIRQGKTLVSVGNFDAKDQTVHLSIDWTKLGLNPAKAILYAPEVEHFQEERTFKTDALIPVESKKGCLLIIKEK